MRNFVRDLPVEFYKDIFQLFFALIAAHAFEFRLHDEIIEFDSGEGSGGEPVTTTSEIGSTTASTQTSTSPTPSTQSSTSASTSTQNSTPTTASIEDLTTAEEADDGPNLGLILGLTFGCTAAVGIGAFGVWYFYFRKNVVEIADVEIGEIDEKKDEENSEKKTEEKEETTQNTNDEKDQ